MEEGEGMQIDLGMMLAVIGGLVGVGGWFSGRDKNLSNDAEWRGGVNAKLDIIVGIKQDVEDLHKDVKGHEGRLAAAESSAKQAHKRLDEHIHG